MTTMTRRAALAGTAGIAMAAATGRATAQAPEAVNIGWTGPLSGGAALYGKNTLSGLELAAKEINDAGGFEVAGKKHTLNIVALDDKYAPAESAVNAKRLRAQNKVAVVFCPHSGGSFAIQAFNEADGFVLASYTSVPQITERGNKLTLRIPPSFAGYVDPFIRTTMTAHGTKLGMAGADHDYAKAWAALIGPAWKAAGGTIVAENPMSYNKDTDFYSGVSRVLAGAPDVMFIGGASEPTALVIKQARELGFKGGFMVMDQAKLDEISRTLGGDMTMLEGAIGTLPLIYDPRPGAVAFAPRYKKAFNRDAGSEASLNYTALNGFVDAMKLAGTVTDATAIQAKLNDAFAALPDDRNPSVIKSVDPKGGSNARLLVGHVKAGKVNPIEISAGSGL